MRSLAALESAIEQVTTKNAAPQQAEALLQIAEEVIEHWVAARGEEPTQDEREGLRHEFRDRKQPAARPGCWRLK